MGCVSSFTLVKQGTCRVSPGTRETSPEPLNYAHDSTRGSSPSTRASTSLSTRESSPESRLEIMSISTSSGSCVSPLPPFGCTPPDSPLRKTPIPPDSALFSKPAPDATRQRVKSFTRSLRKARSFRATREKSAQPPQEAAILDLTGKEVTFLIKKSLSGRVGWKIMPEDDNLNLKINATILEQVMSRIRDMQFSGEVIPAKMSIVIQ